MSISPLVRILNTTILTLSLGLAMMVGELQADEGVSSSEVGSSKVIKPDAADIFFESVKDVGADVKSIALTPFENPKKTLQWGALIGGLVLIDRQTTEFYQQDLEPRLSWRLDSISPAFRGADGYIIYGLGAHYLGSALAGSEKGQEVSLMAGKSMAYSVLFTHMILKPIFGRNRPSPDLASCPTVTAPYTCDPYDFGHHFVPGIGPAQYGTAMPSFHFTMYFSVARVYQLSYDNYWVPYGLAALAATSNIRGHKHWVSDMVAGAALGILIGTKVFNNSKRQRTKSNVFNNRLLLPIIDQQKIGVIMYVAI